MVIQIGVIFHWILVSCCLNFYCLTGNIRTVHVIKKLFDRLEQNHERKSERRRTSALLDCMAQ